MKQIPLGTTGLMVSELCLGTMTWGTQNSEGEGHDQIAMALDHGVNFLDTAEMYPTNPVSAETVGDTERVIGTWLAAKGGRDRMILATKVTGEGSAATGGAPITPARMRQAVEASLGRLQTDYIDIYQMHWPNRGSYHFRKIWEYVPPTDKAAIEAEMLDILQEAQRLKDEGKIRHIALSNDTVWGAAAWLRLADQHGLPRMATVQNEYSLLCRQFDSDWAEFAALENMPLLGYSPLATGLLTGKYAGDVIPAGSRRERTPNLGGRISPFVFEAVAAYLGIAKTHGLDPTQMALAFYRTRPFPCLPIIGATRLDQLKTCLDSVNLTLNEEVLADLDQAHRAWPAPF
ncbi:aldo/keto reductase [Falsirhodobacter halotolerans]|uniref:aldo/keto reductase n=1 Tax=Falsirhodobacter halotolerans TaxID=1146892 RepID=UPI001FD280BE|nr:aldo/keto reductase [Falsirhodobacter halotolerans]MCJ8140472.1 aldo/keto reductase [Falsirhodobacter halotolerans]